jgi:hypothetical protein
MSEQPEKKKLAALFGILKRLPVKSLYYGSAVGMIAVVGGANLPPELAAIATSIGVNILSSMLERVARGEAIPDEELQRLADEAITKSDIAQLLTKDEFKVGYARLAHRLDVVRAAIGEGETVLAQLLTQQFAQHKVLLTELSDYLLTIQTELSTLATKGQMDEVRLLLNQLVNSNAFGYQETLVAMHRHDFYKHIPPPPNYVPRPDLIDEICSALLGDEDISSVPGIKRMTTLHGMGGIGKSVLARSLCDIPAVQAAFPGGILLAKLGKEPNLTANLREWINALGGTIGENAPTIDSLKVKLAELLENRTCLLIVDNVWEKNHIETFRVGGNRCHLLLTTRHAEIARSVGAEVISILPMGDKEAKDLLKKWAGENIVIADERILMTIVTRLGRLPLAIKLAGAQLQRKSPEKWLEQFNVRKLGERHADADDVHSSLERCFNLSLDELGETERMLYAALAIFKEDTPIYGVAVAHLWSALAEYYEDDTEELLEDLASRALLEVPADQFPQMTTLHSLLRDFVGAELNDPRTIHEALLDSYRETQAGDGWHTAPDDGYLYNNLVYHLCAVGDHSEVEKLFQSSDWMLKQLEINQYRYDRVIEDIELIWTRLLHKSALKQLDHGEFELFASCFRFALIRTSINSIAETLSPTVINAGIEHGIWTIDAAISIVQRTSDPSRRLEICIALLVERDDLSSGQQLILHRIFFETIQLFPDYSTVVNALQKIGTRLHSEYVDQALLIVKDIVFLSNRMEGLAALLPLLSYDRQVQLLQESIEEIAQQTDELDKGRALAAIAPHLTADFIPTAIELIKKLRGHYERSSTIVALVKKADRNQIHHLYQAARTISDGKERARAISGLADYLPYELVDDAITAISDVDEIYSRIQAQVKLAPYVDSDRQDAIFRTILEDIRNNNNTFTRCDFALRSSPMGLYEQLPNKYQIEAIKCCYETGLVVVNSGWHRAQAFALALFRICQRDDITEFTDMFERAFYELIHLAVATFGGLSELVAYLPEEQARIAIKTILEVMDLPVDGEDEQRKNQNRKDRAVWVTRILPLLSTEDRTKTLDKIVETAFSLPIRKDVLDVISSVIPFLQKTELQGVISRLSQIQDRGSRAGALSRIAQHLPKSSQLEILERVLREYLPQMLTENEKAFTIARISAMLEDTQLHHCFALIDEFTSETAKAIALANIARNVANPPIDQIYNAAISLSDNEAKALIIEALADDITPQQIDECISFVVSLSNVKQKTKILSSFVRRMSKQQIYRCFNEIQSGENEVIEIVIAASLASELDLQDREQFLAKAVDTIWSTEIGRSQFGIIWGITSIAPYLEEHPRDRMLGYALHLFSTMSGNHASYPSGNPKTNIAKKLISHLSPEMQIKILDEIRTIPRLGGLVGENSSPLAQVLEETAHSLSEEALPLVLNLLSETENGWGKTHSLEAIAENIPDSQLDRFLEVTEGISSGWMRARILDKLPIKLIDSERVKVSVRRALLEHLLEMKERKREELLWSVDVNLFCSPYIEKETLLKLTSHIHEICDTWNWQLST